MEEEISLVELFDILRKHLTTIIISVVVTTVIAGVYTFVLATPTYESTTEMLVSQSTEEEGTNVSRQDIDTSIQLINTYSDIIRNEVILNPVIDELGLDMSVKDLRDNISVERESDSQVFSIQVQDENPYQASEIANTISETFQSEIDQMMNVDNVTVISAAVPITNPVSPNNLLNLIIGIVLGGMIGIMITFIRELLDTTVKSEDFITNEIGWTSLGQVTVFTKEDLTVKTLLPREETETNEQEELQRTRRRV